MKQNTNYNKPNVCAYRFTTGLANIVVNGIYQRKYIRNELKHIKGPYVLICNHQCKLDGLYVFGINKNLQSMVISQSFYESLPINGFLKKLGMISKQQFQTTPGDMRKLQTVVENGQPLVIYPAGLMTENGISTPIPQATYKFIKWLNVDVYVARVYGSYFVEPKWGKGFRRGKTLYDVYKLIDKDNLPTMDTENIKQLVDDALLYDAYAEQEKLLIPYHNGNDIRGLENVLYRCPQCNSEDGMEVIGKDTISCKHCGYSEKADKYGFLHLTNGNREIRHACQWDCEIYDKLRDEVMANQDYCLTKHATICQIDYNKHKFVPIGEGDVTLNKNGFVIDGTLNGEKTTVDIPISNICVLPNSTSNKHVELQKDKQIYRCIFEEGKFVMQYLHLLKIFFEINNGVVVKYYPNKKEESQCNK